MSGYKSSLKLSFNTVQASIFNSFNHFRTEKVSDSSGPFPYRVVLFIVQKTTNRWLINIKHFTQVRVKSRLIFLLKINILHIFGQFIFEISKISYYQTYLTFFLINILQKQCKKRLNLIYRRISIKEKYKS